MKKCKKCLESKALYSFSKHVGMSDGHLNTCKNCIDLYRKSRPEANKRVAEKSRRKIGIPSIDFSNGSHTKIGRKSEVAARNFFIRRGFEVDITNGKGSDLIITNGSGNKTRVEVKTAYRHVSCNSWYVSRVEPTRINDDVIVIVKNNKIVSIESMKSHLLKCSKGGKRCVTKLKQNMEALLEV